MTTSTRPPRRPPSPPRAFPTVDFCMFLGENRSGILVSWASRDGNLRRERGGGDSAGGNRVVSVVRFSVADVMTQKKTWFMMSIFLIFAFFCCFVKCCFYWRLDSFFSFFICNDWVVAAWAHSFTLPPCTWLVPDGLTLDNMSEWQPWDILSWHPCARSIMWGDGAVFFTPDAKQDLFREEL